jgi:ATP-dependent Clp protease ATP-binding subunit ClpA
MFERFDAAARLAMAGAQDEAERLGNGYIGTEHLLLGLARDGSGLGARALVRAGFDAARAREGARRLVEDGAAMLGDQDAEALRAIGIDLDEIKRRTEEAFGPGALGVPPGAEDGRRPGGPFGRRPLTARAKRCLALSLRAAVGLHHDHIGPEHVLLGILHEGRGLGVRLLREQGIDPKVLRTSVRALATEEGGGLDARGA